MIWNQLEDVTGVGLWKLKASLPVGNKWKSKVVIKCPLLEEKNMNLSSVQSPRWFGSSAKQCHTCKTHRRRRVSNLNIMSQLVHFVHFVAISAASLTFFCVSNGSEIRHWKLKSSVDTHLCSNPGMAWRRGCRRYILRDVFYVTGSFFFTHWPRNKMAVI